MVSDRTLRRCALAVALGALSPFAPALAQHTERKVTKLAEGVYEIEHPYRNDYLAGGNTTVIIGDRQVFVVDPGFLPADAREDIAQIRQWTDKPVSFVLNTHFHNDHNLANRAYMDAFPSITVISTVETKKDMDLFGPMSESREEGTTAKFQKLMDTGLHVNGDPLSADEKKELGEILERRKALQNELKQTTFQSATLTYDHDFTIDLGHREVEVKFLGRGNTPGDAVVFLPKEKIAAVGDLVVKPIPYMYDGYPSEWANTMDRVAQLNAESIVPGHGPVLHDNSYVYLIRDLLKSAVAQLNAALPTSGPAMFHKVEDYKSLIDLSSFRQKFAGDDKALAAAFDRAMGDLVNIAFREASSR